MVRIVAVLWWPVRWWSCWIGAALTWISAN
jgi:hypothetical protein